MPIILGRGRLIGVSTTQLIELGQELVETLDAESKPKKSDFRAWSVIIADAILPGTSHRERRSLLKSVADNTWKFANWLTHAREIHFNDAEAALGQAAMFSSFAAVRPLIRRSGVSRSMSVRRKECHAGCSDDGSGRLILPWRYRPRASPPPRPCRRRPRAPSRSRSPR